MIASKCLITIALYSKCIDRGGKITIQVHEQEYKYNGWTFRQQGMRGADHDLRLSN